MARIVMLIALFLLANASSAFASVTVNCDRGESLNSALRNLDKRGPNTVSVKGRCAEYVQLRGFDDLKLKGQTGATLVQPHDPPAVGIFAVLTIDASRRVTIDGFKVQAQIHLDEQLFAIYVRNASTDIRLHNMTIEGGNFGVLMGDQSQVTIGRVTARNPGYATVGVFDLSDLHVEDSLFEGHTDPGFWNAGIDAGTGHVTVIRTTIRNMQVGMLARGGGIVDVVNFWHLDPTDGPGEVLIESPLGTNFHGLDIEDGGTVTLAAKLRITNAGQSWGGDSGAVRVSGGSRLNAGNNLEVSGSQGQGVFVSNNSFALLDGSSITGSLNNGLVVVNNSSVSAGSSALTQISGNTRKDVFCDSRSLITGGANIVGATNVQCSNLLAGASEPIP